MRRSLFSRAFPGQPHHKSADGRSHFVIVAGLARLVLRMPAPAPAHGSSLPRALTCHRATRGVVLDMNPFPRQERTLSMPNSSAVRAESSGPGAIEFVCLISMMMALNALAIDTMLPALPKIGAALGVVSANSRQWVVTAYLLGMGLAQIVYGPFSDRFGRKPVLIVRSEE